MKILRKNILINSRKFDNRISKSWKADLLEQTDSLLVFRGIFDREVIHPDLGIIRPGTISIEYFWFAEWFNVFKFFEPNGNFRNFYCNISMPPTFENDVLEYVDLDIDVNISGNFEHAILDVDEFEANAAIYNYSPVIRQNAEDSLRKILLKFHQRDFPFDSTNLI